MVQYANVTKGYGIKYFSIGNEPDIYDTSGPAEPRRRRCRLHARRTTARR